MANKICPVCETENGPGAKHCEVCGERLIASGSVAAGAQDAALPLNAQVDAAAEVLPSPLDELPSTPDINRMAELEEFDQRFQVEGAGFDREEKTVVDPLPPVPEYSSSAVPAAKPAAKPAPTAKLVVYQNKAPAHEHLIVNDETLLGRSDPTSDAYPDLDLAPFQGATEVSRKHAFILREAGRYFIRPISPAGTQVGKNIVELGLRHELNPGDVIILGAAIALKFEL
ncbi:MAG: FHA domain-containing protein [Myxococcota bacterium]|jgi:hypothetical protein|nr:FHA domain-containing protein [Myxococcota bacterium]